jgi:uncharacterized Fe-S radical SAM superfamily protein PflX
MAIQVISASTSSAQSTAITSTKVRVTPSATVFFAVGTNPTAYTGNCEIITAGQTRYINMQGLNNLIAFITPTGTASVSVTPIGAVYASAVAQNSTTYLNP